MSHKILVIDDSPDIHSILRARLAKENLDLRPAYDADSGLALATHEAPDLILLDVDLPGRDGFDICRRLKSDPATHDIPVIFITGEASTDQKIRGLELGAVDYITKPFDPAELRARVRAALRTKELVDLLARKAMVDGLTGLWNRAYFDARLNAEISSARRTHYPLSCIMTDIDKFKSINDSLGHASGDEVLRTVADLLLVNCREPDVVCRFGGEEFGIILPNTPELAAVDVAERLRAAVAAHPFTFRDRPHPVTCSFGVAQLPTDAPPSLVELADGALYRAKRAGRNRVESDHPAIPQIA